MNGESTYTLVQHLVETEWATLIADGAATERMATLVPIATDAVVQILERLLNETMPEEWAA